MAREYLKVLEYIKTYGGEKYKRAEKCKNEIESQYMSEGADAGKEARDIFTEIANELSSIYNLEIERITQWQNSGNFVSYFWAQLKRAEHKNSHISLSLFAEKFEELYRYRLSVELEEKNSSSEDKKLYKKQLNLPLENGLVYISGGNNDGEFEVLKEKDNIKVSQNNYKKVQISYILPNGMDDEDAKKSFIYNAERLLKYYDYIFSEGNDLRKSWWPTLDDYNPGITSDQWLEMLNDGTTFTNNAYIAIAAMYDFGGTATCRQLEEKYGRSSDFYRAALGVQLASKVKKKYNLTSFMDEDGNASLWPILFQGRKAGADEPGSYVWKIRPELSKALKEFNILKYLDKKEENKKLSTKETLEQIKQYIESKGFLYDSGLIENFYLSLKSKPFVILAGTSGTGKTRLVKLFAEAIGAEYKLVPVRPDWSDGSDLFGHYDLNGNFIEGPVCECFNMAYEKPEKPVFLCLDEMNLARVEYYLSDFLSVIEAREMTAEGRVVTTPVAQYEKGIPDNLYIVGTVNMDETTFPFSKKVLDRANTIEFSYVDLMPNFDVTDAISEKLQLPNSFLRTEYLVLSRDCASEQEYVREICAELQAINEILVKADAHVGYRVRDEIVFYMLNNKVHDNLISHDEAFDNEIMQKILPRIQGSSASVRDMLCELFKICAADRNNKNGDTDSEKMRKVLSDDSVSCRYRKSAEKLELMVRRFEEDGFTSYWM